MRADERDGVLHPANLGRYDAHWIDPSRGVIDVVDQYWTVRWKLADGEAVEQAIIDLPAVSLTVETGDVPAGLVITGLHERAWHRRISGAGDVFAIRLRPAGLAVLSSLRPTNLADQTIPITPELDRGLYEFMRLVATEPTTEARVRVADDAIARRLARTPPPGLHLLANRVLDELRARAYHRTSSPLAEHFGVSERTVQRALSATLGIGPKQAARRIRLQEAAQAIAIHDDDQLAQIATRLGYTDQAHFTGDFRATTGTTPGAYRRSIRRLAPDAEDP